MPVRLEIDGTDDNDVDAPLLPPPLLPLLLFAAAADDDDDNEDDDEDDDEGPRKLSIDWGMNDGSWNSWRKTISRFFFGPFNNRAIRIPVKKSARVKIHEKSGQKEIIMYHAFFPDTLLLYHKQSICKMCKHILTCNGANNAEVSDVLQSNDVKGNHKFKAAL